MHSHTPSLPFSFFFPHSLAYAALFWSLALVMTVDWRRWQFRQCLVRQNSSWKASIQNKEQTTVQEGRLNKTEPTGRGAILFAENIFKFSKKREQTFKRLLESSAPPPNHPFILPQTHRCLASISPSVFFLIRSPAPFSHTLLTVTSSSS